MLNARTECVRHVLYIIGSNICNALKNSKHECNIIPTHILDTYQKKRTSGHLNNVRLNYFSLYNNKSMQCSWNLLRGRQFNS